MKALDNRFYVKLMELEIGLLPSFPFLLPDFKAKPLTPRPSGGGVENNIC